MLSKMNLFFGGNIGLALSILQIESNLFTIQMTYASKFAAISSKLCIISSLLLKVSLDLCRQATSQLIFLMHKVLMHISTLYRP